MKKPTIIYLVRHGESLFNEQGLWSGHSDPPLTDKGRAQLRVTRDKLQNIHFDTAYSSDLIRAIETAEIIHGHAVPGHQRLGTLRERSFGSLEGQPEHLMNQKRQEWQELPDDKAWHHRLVPDMETDHELAERYIQALQEIAQANLGKTILVASHGGAIRTTVMRLKGWNLKQIPPGSFKNAGYVELEYSGSKLRVLKVMGS